MHAFAGRFVARGRGGIVLTSALGAFQGLPNMAHDSAAKAYVLNLGVGGAGTSAAAAHESAGNDPPV